MLIYLLWGVFLALLLLPLALLVSALLPGWTDAKGRRFRYQLLRARYLWPLFCLGAFAGLRTLYRWTNVTAYAAGYSEARFRQVTRGMSETQVIRLLGEPFVKWQSHYNDPGEGPRVEVLEYTKSQGQGDYEIRQVRLKGSRVIKTEGYYYYD